MKKQLKTSWEASSTWYDEIVGEKGFYYHKHVIFPHLLKAMNLKNASLAKSVLDLACGQGVLSRQIPKHIEYIGIDLSSSLIQFAKKRNHTLKHSFIIADVTKKLPLADKKFSHIVMILALQNIENPNLVLKNAFLHMEEKGSLFLVLNHPCFRIPRQSQWGIDEKKKLQYRRIDSYLSPMKIPIIMSNKKKEITWSFHHSLSDLSQLLMKEGFVIFKIEEWVSDKKSTGAKARIEDRARKEFPLFLLLVCKKGNS